MVQAIWRKRLDTILIIPGLGDSGDLHWQSWFEARLPNCTRVRQRDWETTDLDIWVGTVNEAAEAASGRIWLVAHSFGCLAAVRAATSTTADIAGALLVAPADPAKFALASALPATPLPVATILVGSENDAWMSLRSAQRWARTWGSVFVNAGRAGHINVASGYGPWPDGLRLLGALRSANAAALRCGLTQPHRRVPPSRSGLVRTAR
jgi:serine hydrolase